MGCKAAQQLETLSIVRISNQLWIRCFGKPKPVDLIMIAYSPFEVRSKMLSCGCLVFAVLSVGFSELFFTILYSH